jgi:hypothetical protein
MALIAGITAALGLRGVTFTLVEKLGPFRATFVKEDLRANAAAMTGEASSAAQERPVRGCNTRLKTVLSRNPMHC